MNDLPTKAEKSKVWLSKQFNSLVLAFSLLFTITAIGTSGYMFIEGWSFLDSLFMTIISISTVGYGLVEPLSPAGVWFTCFLIIVAMSVALYCFSLIGQIALEGELYRFRGMYKMRKRIDSFNNHIIVCGYGRLARTTIPDLLEFGTDVVVLDTDPNEILALELDDIPFIEGNAFDDFTLKQAGIERASALLAILPSDADNVYITLSARTLNKQIKILARSEDPAGEAKLKLAGANQVISPFRVSGNRLVQQLLHPNVNDFLQIITDKSGTSLVLEQVIIPPSSPLGGRTIGDAEVRTKTGVMIAACIATDGNMILAPDKNTVLESGIMVVILGTKESIDKFQSVVEA